MPFSLSLRAFLPSWRLMLIVASLFSALVLIGVIFFFRGETLMADQIKERLRSTAAAAALSFEASAIERVKGEESDLKTANFREIVDRLDHLRHDIPEIRFAYLMRRTEDPMTLEFVADADTFATTEELDRNDNGVVDTDEEASLPGDEYDISEVPALQDDAFVGPAVDAEFTVDQWGTLISGYAPIHNADGTVAAVLGIDMSATDFIRLSRSIFSPVALLLFVIAAFIIATYVFYVSHLRQVESLHHLEDERTGLMQLTFHQLGTPLTVFKWSLELLKEQKDGKEVKSALEEHIRNMEDAIGRMDNIVDTLREADQVHAGTLRYAPEVCPLTEVINEVAAEFRPRFEHRKQQFTVTANEDFTVHVDRKLIAGVLREVLSNALDFTPEGAAVSITAIRNGKDVKVTVEDRGYGISKVDMQRIFAEFARGKDAGRHNTEGVGLGLYISKGIVESAGGRMWAESQEGHWTRVTFTLPLS